MDRAKISDDAGIDLALGLTFGTVLMLTGNIPAAGAYAEGRRYRGEAEYG